MNSIFKFKVARYGVAVVAVLVLVGAIRLAQGGNDQADQVDPNQAIAEAEGQLNQAYQKGALDAIEGTVNGRPDALLVQRQQQAGQASELAEGDILSAVCARATEYLKSAAQLSADQQTSEERWLRAQLSTENQTIKSLLGQYSTLSGRADHLETVDGPLINRAAILMALRSIDGAPPPVCRIAPYDSTAAIDSYLFTAERIESGRLDWAAPPAATADDSGEVATNEE